ncbi:MAG TPA: MgtC/SapB family protein [Mariprofundaceae bacterium]|nr:MgtC/SapB family protein [Mariprofundaceae bacterium]
MESDLTLLMQAMAALGIGLLIGVERQYGQRRIEGEKLHREAAGIRTFALISLFGNLLTWLPEPIMAWGIAMGLGFTGLIALYSYRRTSRGEEADKGITSEVVLVLTYALGTLAGLGYMLPAVIVAVVVFALLRSKKVLHRFSYSLSDMDMRQALQFLIITVVILPILPNHTYGPYAFFNPQRTWLMVVLISGIGFSAYAAIKLMGQRAGLGLTGILGGMASSTAVTLAMSRLSRTNPALQTSCLLSILLACTTMYPRVLVLSLLFAPKISLHLVLPVFVILAYMLIATYYLWRHGEKRGESEHIYRPEVNPLSLRAALGFAAFYSLIVLLTHMGKAHFGGSGILAVAGISGLTDVDAITLSVSDMTNNGMAYTLAAQAILLACGSNSLVKMGIGLAFVPQSAKAWLIAGLLPMAAFSLLAIFLI